MSRPVLNEIVVHEKGGGPEPTEFQSSVQGREKQLGRRSESCNDFHHFGHYRLHLIYFLNL
jgi:hypothetical protein